MKIRRISNERCLLADKTSTQDLPWTNHDFVEFASGREALVALIRSLNLKEGDIVLLPAFVPEGIISPCRIQKLDIRFYVLDRNLDPDWIFFDKLAHKSQPKLAILIHYFGVRRDANRFVTICHSRGAMVLEDFAHMQILPETKLGLNSDFALHSLRKIIGVPDGAILQTNFLDLPSLKPKISFDLRRITYILMNMGHLSITGVSRWSGSPSFWRNFWKIFGRFFSSYRFLMWYFKRPTPMSRLSKFLLSRFPWRAAVSKRIHYEQIYHNMLDRNIFTHLSQPEDGHCSMGYAVLVENRNSLYETLARQGIYGIWFEYKWDHFPEGSIQNDARWVMKNHFLFPTAYSLREEEITRVILLANEWAESEMVIDHKNYLSEH